MGRKLAVFAVDYGLFAGGVALGLSLSAAQIASFAAAGLLAVIFQARQVSGRESCAPFLGRMALVLAMAFFLRSGVLAALGGVCGWPPAVAIVPAILASMLVFHFGNRPWVAESFAKREGELAVLGVTLFLVALRLVYLPSVELLPEEAYYWNYAQHPALGYLDHPPMVAWLIAGGTFLLGHNMAGVRLGAALCWGVAGWFAFRMARLFFGGGAGARAVLLLALLPAFFGAGFFMTPDAPLAACWAGALYFFARVFFEGAAWAWLGAGAAIGLGMDSKYTIALTGLGAILFVLLDKPSRRWLRHPAPYLAAGLSVVLFFPVIFWNEQNQWASFVFQGPRRWEMTPRFSLHELAVSMLILLTPVGFAAAAGVLWRGAGSGEGERRRLLFARTFTFVPLSIFAYFSLKHRVEFNWTAPLWLALLPSMAATMEAGRMRAWWRVGGVATILLYGAALYHLSLGWPGLGYPHHTELFPAGWANLARQVDGLEDELEKETKKEPMTVGMGRYQTLSELIFYNPDQAEAAANGVGVHLFGQRSLMFERWTSPEAASGRNILLIGLEPNDLTDASVTRHFLNLTAPQKRDVNYNGRVVRSFYYRVGYGYVPKPKRKLADRE